jgi:hypothetical protein
MPANYEIIKQAILGKLLVSATHHGLVRELCPHSLGLNKNGRHQGLFFQFAGENCQGLHPEGEWRCIPIDALQIRSVYQGTWRTKPEPKPDGCLSHIDVEVS